MEEQNKRKSIIYLVIGVLTLIALVIGATYAYFQAQTGNNAVANLNTTTGTTNNLTFSTDGNILINASADNFGENMGDQVSQASAMATLIPNNTDNYAEETYNVYLVINENTFEYTKDEETPELILSVKKDGGEYIEVKELTIKENIEIQYKPEEQEDLINETIKGYDITTKRGLIKIADGIKIKADEKQKTDNWEIRIILKNLITDQNKNTGKTFNGKIIIQKENIPTKILDVCTSGDNIANCLIKLHDKSEYGITKLVYHDEKEDYKGETNYTLEAGDFSYRYSGASEEVNNYVCFGGDCSSNPENENYSNLYRIIGVFPTTATKDSPNKEYQIKLIKADYTTEEETGGEGVGAYYGEYNLGSNYYKGNVSIYYPKIKFYFWNRQQNNSVNSTNDWSKSNLNTENLNKTYLNYIKDKDDDKWYNMIEEDHIWITAGNTITNIYQNARTVYTNEIKKPDVGVLSSASQTYPAMVGLMYISDYMYSASKESWTTSANTYGSVKDNNWMYMGLREWPITRRSDLADNAIIVDQTGTVGHGHVSANNIAIRPVLYLNSSVKISSGSGTSDAPYILSL